MLTTLFILLLTSLTTTNSIDFLFNSFPNSTIINLLGEASITSSVLQLTNDSTDNSFGRAFYPTKLHLTSPDTTTLLSFSTSFIFSIVPAIESSPGFGLAFVLSNSTSPPGAISGQYFGLFSNAPHQSPGPLLAIEFDTGFNPEFGETDGNHVGIDLNYVKSAVSHPAGYYRSNGSAVREFVPLNMRSGRNIRAWIEFEGSSFSINVTIAPAEEPRPVIPLIIYSNPVIANYVSSEMFVGFSASKAKWVEIQRVLAWSLSDTGTVPVARELNTSNLPNFVLNSSSNSSWTSRIVAIVVSLFVVVIICLLGVYLYRRRRARMRRREEEDEDDFEEGSEFKYWPMRFNYEDLYSATNGFSRAQLLGSGGFGKVYKAVLPCQAEFRGEEVETVAVKCVSHDSKQGKREFMAEISTIGRLQHRSLVQMKGWCQKRNELMLVYEYMPNGNLSEWIFSDAEKDKFIDWTIRRKILMDVAEGLLYLHHGWEQVVLHRDVKSSNILLDANMRGRLGDFGLAKLYQRGATPCNTRVVGTLGYLAPESAVQASPTAARDVYSFGVVILEVVSGRRPIERAMNDDDDDWLLVDWAREKYNEKELVKVADYRMKFKVDEIELVLKLGLACCHPEPEQRPSMKEVVELLQAVIRGTV